MKIRNISPAFRDWLEELGSGMVWGQVMVSRVGPGFALMHVADHELVSVNLRCVAVEELRELALKTAAGEFRPLKSAPNLVRGWHCLPRDEFELEEAVDSLYPASIADWHAWRSEGLGCVTDYRTFVGRQTGMYKVANQMDDLQAARAVQAGCDARFCGKLRCWTVPGLKRDEAGTKNRIPCLEPCAVMLELARRTFRLEQDEAVTLRMNPGDLETLSGALEKLLEGPINGREGDSGDPLNGRRLQRVLNLLKPLMAEIKTATGHGKE